MKKLKRVNQSKGKLQLIKLKFKPTRLTRKPLDNSKRMAKYIRKLFKSGTFHLQEECIILLFDSEYFPISYYPLSKGDRGSCIADHRFILQILFLSGADGFVLAHNHPNEVSQPSEADVASVVSLKHKADMFEFTYIDDLVITKKGHYSFAENGLVIGLGEH